MSQIIELENNVEIIRSEKLKERKFLYNTISEYRNGYYLREKYYAKQKFSLDVRFIQKGDYSIGKNSFELKENRGALSVSELSFEVFNTKKSEKSGLSLAFKDKVDYFLMYLPLYKPYKGKYSEYVENLLIFKTEDLYHWITQREELEARNNNFLNSNALCYKVPCSYLEDCESFKSLIRERIRIPEEELKKISVPKEIYSCFQPE